jgi:uncharacterized protein YpmS
MQISPQTARDIAALDTAALLAGAVLTLALALVFIFRLFWGREKELVQLNLDNTRLLGQQLTESASQLRLIQDKIEDLQSALLTLKADIEASKAQLTTINRIIEGCLRSQSSLKHT